MLWTTGRKDGSGTSEARAKLDETLSSLWPQCGWSVWTSGAASAMPGELTVRWNDGPAEAQVAAVAHQTLAAIGGNPDAVTYERFVSPAVMLRALVAYRDRFGTFADWPPATSGGQDRPGGARHSSTHLKELIAQVDATEESSDPRAQILTTIAGDIGMIRVGAVKPRSTLYLSELQRLAAFVLVHFDAAADLAARP